MAGGEYEVYVDAERCRQCPGWTYSICWSTSTASTRATQLMWTVKSTSWTSFYRLAAVTLIASCGEDASFGLPGVGLTRRTEQQTINLSGQVFVSCFEDPTRRIERSKWNSRGWTYQDGLFSRRRLFFTEEQVYLECNNMGCQESAAYDLHYLSEVSEIRPAGIFQGAFSFERSGALDGRISDCTLRDLTFQSDAINAMRGVFRAFAAFPAPTRHFWGIPMEVYGG